MKKNKFIQTLWWGRFGNRLFQYAFGATLKHRYGIEYYVPSKWEGSDIFKNDFATVIPDQRLMEKINAEPVHKNWGDPNFNQRIISDYNLYSCDNVAVIDGPHYDAETNFALTKDSQTMSAKRIHHVLNRKELITEVLLFSERIQNSEAYCYFKERKYSYDVINLRRAEIANWNSKTNYIMVPEISYGRYCRQNGISYRDCLIISDDLNLSQNPFKNCIKTSDWSYPEGAQPGPEMHYFMYDFFAMMFARNLLTSNSSFSWWAAFFNEEGAIHMPRITVKPEWAKKGPYVSDCEFTESRRLHWLMPDRTIDYIDGY